MTFDDFQNTISYTFKNPELLQISLTHSSYANEHKLHYSNERPEFLGDSVLGFITAEYLYAIMGGRPEGELTKRRAELVCESALYGYAKQIGIGEVLLLGRGEASSGGNNRPSVLADAFEAVVAAIFLDGGISAAKSFVIPFISDAIDSGIADSADTADYKSVLQEEIQKIKGNELCYKLASENGPDHDKVFEFDVLLNGEIIGKGSGKTKKEAQQHAARNALEVIKK